MLKRKENAYLTVYLTMTLAVILSLFAPQGRMNRFYKMLLSLFVFVSFIYPFRDFKLPDFDAQDYFPETAVAAQQSARGEAVVSQQVSEVLKESGIVGASVSSRADYDIGSGELRLLSVEVAVPDAYRTDEVQALLLAQLGINARVIHVGD